MATVLGGFSLPTLIVGDVIGVVTVLVVNRWQGRDDDRWQGRDDDR